MKISNYVFFHHEVEPAHQDVGDERGVLRLGLLGDIHGFEGPPAGEKDVRNHAQTPHVAALVVALLEHLRSSSVGGSHDLSHRQLTLEAHPVAEVDNLDLSVRSLVLQQDVLQFDVSVADSQLVDNVNLILLTYIYHTLFYHTLWQCDRA